MTLRTANEMAGPGKRNDAPGLSGSRLSERIVEFLKLQESAPTPDSDNPDVSLCGRAARIPPITESVVSGRLKTGSRIGIFFTFLTTSFGSYAPNRDLLQMKPVATSKPRQQSSSQLRITSRPRQSIEHPTRPAQSCWPFGLVN